MAQLPDNSGTVARNYESRHNPRTHNDHGAVHRAGHPQNGSGFQPGGPRPGQNCDWYGDPLDDTAGNDRTEPAQASPPAGARR